MYKFSTKIYGLDCIRISKAKARNLCKKTDLLVYICMAYINPNSNFATPQCLNFEPLDSIDFEKIVASYTYYNKGPQSGYYASFYSEDPDTKPRKSP